MEPLLDREAVNEGVPVDVPVIEFDGEVVGEPLLDRDAVNDGVPVDVPVIEFDGEAVMEPLLDGDEDFEEDFDADSEILGSNSIK